MHPPVSCHAYSGAVTCTRALILLVCLFSCFPLLPQEATDTGSVESERRVRRLGDEAVEREWQPDLRVPGSAPESGSESESGDLPELPGPQQQKLQQLLSQLAMRPGDAGVLAQLEALLADVIADANRALDAHRIDEARLMMEVVEAISPSHDGLPALRERLGEVDRLERLLDAAREAMEAGRIDQPEDNSAWTFYRQALDADPDNPVAQDGLAAVQQALIERALQLAENGEFDSAERLLEDAAFVREDTAPLDVAREEIGKTKRRHAEQIESRAVVAMDKGDFAAAERELVDLVALGGEDQRVNQLRRRLEEARVYGGFKPGQVIRDHFLNARAWAPESVVVLAGSFTMGSPATEEGRAENEGPQHRVTFRRGFAIGRREVTVGAFRTFVDQTGYRTDAERSGRSMVYDQFSGRLMEQKGVHWKMDYEGKPAEPDLPVVHVSWNDAQAYVDWLARGTGKPYRLPSEAEFEYALRAGTTTRYWWGDGSPPRVVENLTGSGDSSRSRRGWTVAFERYSDRYWGPAPAGSLEPNPFGLFDIGGNVGEWVRDCWHDTYVRAPADGSAWVNPGCDQRVVRGGYWASSPAQARSAQRLFARPDFHDARTGFRIARDL